ncbi:ComEA family DNA-binding protein [Nocardia arizonensis]|uniref:ComEA family DNA-binding protein n=1 Tax=Nocardia arizonensis TaxID=1141647 RepID=UPI00195108BB|nr:ComEA family DNA-binding protein [Nocardia arizonensis]
MPERFRGARLDPGRRGVMTLAIVGLIAAIVAAVVVFRERPIAQAVPPVPAIRTSSTATAPSDPAPEPRAAGSVDNAPVDAAATAGELVVSVVGSVHRAGLVHLGAGARVADAVAAAGGAAEGADLTTLNLAQRLGDGDQVIVGTLDPTPGTPRLGSTTLGANARGATTPPSNAATPTTRLSLNRATESDLDALPGIGPITARAIITWRITNGRFTDIEQLGDIDGIGPTRLSRLRELVTL